VKLNVDASFHEDGKTGAIGTVLRNARGEFIAASSMFLANVDSVVMAEAHAMKEGLSLAVTLGCNNVIAESDSTDVIQACTGADSWWSESSAIFADCVDMVVSIGRVTFSHISRDANQVAHSIVRESFLHNLSCTWVDEPLASSWTSS
jgi:ribonuclease HI